MDAKNKISDEFAMEPAPSKIKTSEDDIKNNENADNLDASSTKNFQVSEVGTKENVQIDKCDDRQNQQIEINSNKTTSQAQNTPEMNEDDIAENAEAFADAESSAQQETETKGFKDSIIDYKYIFDQLYLVQEKYEKLKIIEHKYQNVINKFRKYVTARIDIKNVRTAKNKIEILDISDKNARIATAKWLCNDKGNGLTLQSIEENVRIKMKCIEDGQLELWLKGIDYRYNGKRYPIYIKYSTVEINGEKIQLDRDLACHDEDIRYSRTVKNNDIINLYIECSVF